MSNDSARKRAAKVRLDYKKQRADRRAARQPFALADPIVEGMIDDQDGTLNKDVLDAPIAVTIQQWDNLPDPIDGDHDTLQLEMAVVNGDDIGEFGSVGESCSYDNTSPFPTTLYIPQNDYPRDGIRKLRYKINRYNTGTPEYSVPIDLIFDKTPPWDPVEPPVAVLTGEVITDTFLRENPEGLELTLPEYTGQAPTDKCAVYYSDTVPGDGSIPPPVIYSPVPPDRKLLITKDYIETQGDGHFYIVYVLIDKATNRSRISEIAEVFVNLGVLPTALQEPVVPLAGDGLLDLADAQTGVTVDVSFTNYQVSDVIEITWGPTEPFMEPIGGREPPFSVAVPHDRLQTAYGSADDAVTTSVSYRVLRHDVPYGPEETEVEVDFSTAGPTRPSPDPDWPDPVNSHLEAPVVRGEVSDADNVLDRTDTGRNAKFLFKRYESAKAGDIVDFYYAGTLVAEATYTVVLEDKDPVERSLPWSYILEASNNPQLPVYYAIRKASGAGNEQRSLTANVNANAVVIEAEAAEFQRMYGRFLNCDSLWEDSGNPSGEAAFKVFVPPLDKYLPTGGEVNIVWTAFGGRSGDNEIEEARLSTIETISAEQAEAGFYWEVKPYETHILPIYDPEGFGQDGRGFINYNFQFNGETVHSKPAEAVVSLGTGSGTCPIPEGDDNG